MKKYHVLFRVIDDQIHSRGENFDAMDIVQAIVKFEHKYPTAIVIGIFDLEQLDYMRR